jgi:glycerol-1-phosphate dehydrogenase [NAD(P)+]
LHQEIVIMSNNANDCFSKTGAPQSWHSRIDRTTVDEWLGQSKICPACGRVHTIRTRRLAQGDGIGREIGHHLHDLGFKGRCLVVMDRNTRQAAGLELLEGLSAFQPASLVFDREDLHADEQALGSLLVALANRPDFMVSCGSGTLTDITRYNSLMTGIPFVAYATAASVDGFASTTTPILNKGFKTTFPGVAPEAVFYDPAVLAAAPDAMTAAGFGDVMAKIIAMIDWRLAFAVEDEAYCPLIAALVEQAVGDCLALAGDLAGQADRTRRGTACARLMETLSLTGIGMQMMGSSRPASGAEHHISHLLEMRDIQQHKTGSLHGDKVGIGTLISMVIYRRLFAGDRLPEQRPTMPADRWAQEVRRVFGPLADAALSINNSQPPQGAAWESQKRQIARAMDAFGYAVVRSFDTLLPAIRDKITAIGGPVRPDQLGYSVQDTCDAIAFGKEVRPKFTALRLAERFGWLYDLSEDIAAGLPEGRIY